MIDQLSYLIALVLWIEHPARCKTNINIRTTYDQSESITTSTASIVGLDAWIQGDLGWQL